MKLFNSKSPASTSAFAQNASNFRQQQEVSVAKNEIDAVGKIIYGKLSSLTEDELADPNFMTNLISELKGTGFGAPAIYAGLDVARQYTQAATTNKIAKETKAAKEAQEKADKDYYSKFGINGMIPRNQEQTKTLMDWTAANTPKEPSTADLKFKDDQAQVQYEANTKYLMDKYPFLKMDFETKKAKGTIAKKDYDAFKADADALGIKVFGPAGKPIDAGWLKKDLDSIEVTLQDRKTTLLPSDSGQSKDDTEVKKVADADAASLIQQKLAEAARKKAGEPEIINTNGLTVTKPMPPKPGVGVTNVPEMQQSAQPTNSILQQIQQQQMGPEIYKQPPPETTPFKFRKRPQSGDQQSTLGQVQQGAASPVQQLGAASPVQQLGATPALQQLQKPILPPEPTGEFPVNPALEQNEQTLAPKTLEKLYTNGKDLGQKVVTNKSKINAFPDINRTPILGEVKADPNKKSIKLGNSTITIDSTPAEISQVIADLQDKEIVYAYINLKQRKEEGNLSALEEQLYSMLRKQANAIISKAS